MSLFNFPKQDQNDDLIKRLIPLTTARQDVV